MILPACRTIFASPICNLPALDVIEKCFGSSPEFKKWSPKLKDTVETLEHQRTVWRVRSASITRVAAALPKSRRSTAWFARRFQIGVCVCACVVRYSRGKHRKPRHCCYRIWIWSPKPELYIVLDEMKFVQYLPSFLFSLCMNIWINLHWQHWCTKIVLIMQISKATDAGQHPIVMRCTVSAVLNLHLSLSLSLYLYI